MNTRTLRRRPTARRRTGEAKTQGGIVADGLVREFGDGVRAVDGIDLTVAPGELFALLGPNGSGKTTTVRMLTTLLPPTDGRATVNGSDIVREAAQVRASIGAALQAVALDPLLTTWDHMRLVCTLQGLPSEVQRGRIDELIGRVGLADVMHRRVRTFSGGMKRRLDLALALVHRPPILFLDEPTTGLDPQSRAALWEEIGRLAHEDGVAVFLTTQYLEEADVLADRVAIVDHGRIVAEGAPERLKAHLGQGSVLVRPARPSAADRLSEVLSRFGLAETTHDGAVRCRLDAPSLDLTAIVRTLDLEQIAVAALETHAPTLDDVFFATTGRQLKGDRGYA